MKSIARPIALLVGGLFLLSACKDGPNATKLQYMPDMADAPTVKAQENFINPPEHSVTINAILYPESPDLAEQELRNPFGEGAQVNEEVRKQGKKLFETYCHVCHGFDGKGKGTLGDAYPIPVPDLTRDELKAKKDGFFFLKISKGGQQMPAYAYAISPHERWWIVSHLRELQAVAVNRQLLRAELVSQRNRQRRRTELVSPLLMLKHSRRKISSKWGMLA
jgi:mono/diheme cytochrome c family protein